jgi:hypothetical protein
LTLLSARKQLSKSIPFNLIFAVFIYACIFFDQTTHAAEQTIDSGKTYYLFAYFKDNEVPGGGAGLRLAWSADGFTWTPLRENGWFFKPTVGGVFRDPSIARGPGGVFHLVWTTGWTADEKRGIGYASSTDLIHWSPDHVIPVMAHEPTVLNCWAPEIFYDDAKDQFVIFWASTIPGRFPETDATGDAGYNHRMYFTTTRDFITFTPTTLLYDPGFNSIDAFIVKWDNRYVMFLKNETLNPPAKYIVKASAPNATGPYGKPSKQITPPLIWSEGPAVIQINGVWFLYFDQYASHQFGLMVSSDLKKWKDKSSELSMPGGIRHGTVFAVDGALINTLINQ